jgi:large subunit ribosomal protein L25
MATKATLKAQPRQEKGKSATRKMRAAGRIPAIVYGHGDETRMVSVDAHELDLLFARIHYENTVIEVDIEGERGPVKALVREVQSHPVRPQLLHVDFQQLHAGEAINVMVPIRLLGTAAGVRAGGVLMHTETELDLRCMPDNIPEFIDVEVSHLEIGDSIHLRDIALPAGTETTVDADRTICSLAPPAVSAQAAEDVEVEEAAEPGEPEVISRGRDEDENEDAS